MSNLTKRIVSVILAMIMILGTLSAVAAEGNYPFSDFPDGWSKEAMEAAVDNGLLTGMGDGTIAPKDNLTRAQMAAIINRAFGAEIAADISKFTDVPNDAWYRDDIALAVNMQTFTGEGNGQMSPGLDITRQEAFAVLARALVIETNKSVVSDFADGTDISSWAVGDVSALVANGYVNGYPNGTLDPLGNITREEFAQVMHNIFKTYISAEGTVDSVNDGGVMINKPGVTLSNVTVNGDLVLGDGVGKGSVKLDNVKILGRLLCRGGEDKVTLKDTTTTGGVVVKDVNGVVNFNNYRSEPVFDGVREITRATYLTPLSDDEIHVGPSRRPSSPSTEERTVMIYEDSTLSSLIKTVKVEKGSKLYSDLPSDPSRTGYIFDGWYYNEGGTEKKIDSSTRVNTNMTVYGKWKPASGTLYTVKHIKQNIDGTYTTLVETETLSGTTGGTTAAAAKTYDGFTAETFTQGTIAADGSTVVEIKYKRNTYTVKFDSKGGSAVADVSALYEAPITKPANPTKTGYRFVDWYADSALTTPFDFSKMPLGGATVYAKWAASDDVAYTVRHVRQNLDGTYTTLVETETKYGKTGETTAAAAKSYAGFTAESFAQGMIAADGSTVVEIKYKRNTYTLKFDSNGGSAVADIPALYEAPITKPANPTKTGYRFVDWYADSALTTLFNFSKMPLGGATVYAKWAASDDVAYTVRHVRQNLDGTYTTLVETETKYGKTGETTAAAAKSYAGFTAESFAQGMIAADGSTVVEIKYKRNTYTVKYYKDSALTDFISSESVLYEGTAAAIPADPSAPGKTFAGWYYIDSALGETKFDTGVKISEDTDVYAKWTNMYSVSFYMDDTLTKPEIRVIQVEEGSKLTALPADPTKVNYDFIGWAYVDGGVEKTFDTNVVITSDVDVYAKWKLKKYTVYFYNEYSAAPDASILEGTYEAEYGTTVPETEIPDSYENSGYVKNSSVDPVYTAEYKHKIPNEWWYFDGESGEWKLFDDTVPVKSDINVFDMTKNVSFMFNTGRLSNPVSITVPYNSHTRLADTFKDILYSGRSSVKYAFDHTDAYNKLIAKLADPKLGIIDEHGNILNQKLDIGIYEIISSSEIEGEMKNYLETLVKNGGDDLKSVLAFVSVPELVSAVGTDAIIEYVDNAKLLSMVKLASMRATLVEFMKVEFVNDASFRDETIAALTNILTNDDEAMLSLAAYVRGEYNRGNTEIINFVNNTMHIPDISYIDNPTLAAAMKTQASSMPEFMAQYIIYRINMNDPKIDECVNKFIDNDMDAAFVGRIKTILTHDARIESIINKYLDENSAEAGTLIADYVDSLSDAKKVELSDKIFDKISEQSTYKNFIKAFEDKDAEFEVTPDNVSFLLGVANAVNSYTYEGLRDKFRAKFGSLIDLIGEDTVRTYFDSAKDDYYNGAVALADRIKADKAAGITASYRYKTSLTFKANLMRDILVPKYRTAVAKVADKLKSKEQVKYNDNVYLKALVEKDMISALFDTTPADEIYSGYKLKDDPMAYYDLMYAMVVLADDAVLYYDYVDYDTAFEKITPYAVKIMNKFVAVVDHFDKTGELPGGLDSKLSSISKIAEFYGAFEDMLNAAADEILASSLNQTYTEADFKNQSIKAATGFINLVLKQFNDYVATGKLPFKADALIERISKINELYKKYGSDAHKLAAKLAEFNFNHAYTEGEVESYEEYVKHVYTLLNEAEDPAFSVDDMYDIIDVFFGDILDKLEFTPDDAEGVINLDGYKAEAKGSEASVIRFYR